MTADEYYAAVHRLGLTPTKAQDVFLSANKECISVPSPIGLNAAEMLAILARIRRILMVQEDGDGLRG